MVRDSTRECGSVKAAKAFCKSQFSCDARIRTNIHTSHKKHILYASTHTLHANTHTTYKHTHFHNIHLYIC